MEKLTLVTLLVVVMKPRWCAVKQARIMTSRGGGSVTMVITGTARTESAGYVVSTAYVITATVTVFAIHLQLGLCKQGCVLLLTTEGWRLHWWSVRRYCDNNCQLGKMTYVTKK